MAVVVIAESEFTQVVYREGRKNDILWVTWGDMGSRPNGTQAWGQSLFEKMDASCLGFVAKAQTWYPQADTLRLIDLSANVLSRYSRRIAYGFSMGGYAALKFSSRIEASECLAYSPQFSIDPLDVGEFERDYTSRFDPDVNRGMAIRAEDLCATNYIVYDPLDRSDRQHFDLIKSCKRGSVDTVRGIVAPAFGHHSINIIGQTGKAEELLGLVATAWTNVPKEFRKSLRWRRVVSNYYWKGLADAAALRGHAGLEAAARKWQAVTWGLRTSPVRWDVRQLFALHASCPEAGTTSTDPILRRIFSDASKEPNTLVISARDEISDISSSADKLIVVGTEGSVWRDAEIRFGWQHRFNSTIIEDVKSFNAEFSMVWNSAR